MSPEQLKNDRIEIICGKCKWAGSYKYLDSYKNTFSCPNCGHIVNDDK